MLFLRLPGVGGVEEVLLAVLARNLTRPLVRTTRTRTRTRGAPGYAPRLRSPPIHMPQIPPRLHDVPYAPLQLLRFREAPVRLSVPEELRHLPPHLPAPATTSLGLTRGGLREGPLGGEGPGHLPTLLPLFLSLCASSEGPIVGERLGDLLPRPLILPQLVFPPRLVLGEGGLGREGRCVLRGARCYRRGGGRGGGGGDGDSKGAGFGGAEGDFF